MKNFFFSCVVFFILSFLIGCHSNSQEQEFGTIIEGLPQVEGADRPYEMLELGPPPKEDSAARKKHV